MLLKEIKKTTNDKRGFTLAELLIVVAIIGVLVAISIPIFTSQLKKSRLGTNQANARAAYAAATAAFLENDDVKGGTYHTGSGDFDESTDAVSATAIQDTNIQNWYFEASGDKTVVEDLGKNVYNTWTVALDGDGKVTGYAYSNS